MAINYSICQAKDHFEELMRFVREGGTVTLTHEGEPVAEIRPPAKQTAIEKRIDELRAKGLLSGPSGQRKFFEGGTYVPGALKMFLDDRD